MDSRLSAIVVIVAAVAVAARAQTCLRPAAECPAPGTLHCGGEWDFEAGFYFVRHHLAGRCAGPPGGGNVFCVPGDKQAQVAVGWTHWAAFPDWPTPGYWGTVAFNENKNCENVYRGNRSQELTLTCANGVGVIYKQATVPANHRIRVEAYMKFTPNGPAPDVEHALGLDPWGGTDPTSPGIVWTLWQQQTPSPPQPGGVFNQAIAETISQGTQLTVFIRQRGFEPECQGQTFMIDHVRVFDLGPNGPAIEVNPTSLVVSTPVESDALPQTLTIRNAGTQILDYTITTQPNWLTVSPASGSAISETDTVEVTFDTDALSFGQYSGTITVSAAGAVNSPQVVPVSLTIISKPADLDLDGDVDQVDFGLFQRCYTGQGLPQTDGTCFGADLDQDDDVDQDDFALFARCISGPGQPSSPTCLR
ncbi:MAG TPA: hypothetical protein PLQ89_07105 [Phycisphaerae bacterium]|nr:hypothetical protein [Phycisphaerae bacterium]